ncbi:hypothetical protein CC1G_13767 [Coprinopsis cinerea okayama7|uniref:Uncharacterized protein n=1 Tax=Coprinopsis cinerea (strain Okayama-7 / 130 / ATCC MYA-4618 / FGSC 9003) TaxID=240176 RepID=D6RKB4_COPC7|nr:hypothetical protein CC1G_13767 [Coprinopsis cinerea okayama7\|eukprot:XP_002912235.1 hypothetical protein CC1G_13767 [Coprinopsis cinerea okayama7\
MSVLDFEFEERGYDAHPDSSIVHISAYNRSTIRSEVHIEAQQHDTSTTVARHARWQALVPRLPSFIDCALTPSRKIRTHFGKASSQSRSSFSNSLLTLLPNSIRNSIRENIDNETIDHHVRLESRFNMSLNVSHPETRLCHEFKYWVLEGLVLPRRHWQRRRHTSNFYATGKRFIPVRACSQSTTLICTANLTALHVHPQLLYLAVQRIEAQLGGSLSDKNLSHQTGLDSKDLPANIDMILALMLSLTTKNITLTRSRKYKRPKRQPPAPSSNTPKAPREDPSNPPS